jgi:hypothetical protein
MGFADDFSYIWSARVLADTGHIAYNGWGAMMLGWQLYWGALFIKLFGFSFNVLHASGLVLAMATAALTQRVLVRLGNTEWNSTIATLCLTSSPVFLPLCFSFMSDVPSFMCMLVCLYGCLRAVQAETDRAAMGWLIFAGFSNALGGTVRQIAWLGVLVMVPCTTWVLRRRRGMLATGAAVWALSAGFVAACMQWFKQQPYSVSEKLITKDPFRNPSFAHAMVVLFFCLPILIAFLPAVPIRQRRVRLQCVAALALLASLGVFLALTSSQGGMRHELRIAPFSNDWVTARGFYLSTDPAVRLPSPPEALLKSVRIALTLLTCASLLAFLICVMNIPPARRRDTQRGEITARTMFALLGPFTAAYALLVETRAWILERYFIPLIFVLMVALLQAWQSRIAARLPRLSVLFTVLFASYAVAQTHDFRSFARARLRAVDELRAAGVPSSEIAAGWDYDGWTQLELVGYTNDPRLNRPADAPRLPPPLIDPRGCFDPYTAVRLPAIRTRYELSYGPSLCFPESEFPPLAYTAWLPPSQRKIYVLTTGK